MILFIKRSIPENMILLAWLLILSLFSSVSTHAAAANIKPVANAGSDQVIQIGNPVTLNGTGSSDSDGQIKRWQWKQTAGQTVKLTGAKTSTPKFTSPKKIRKKNTKSISLKFKLTVYDNKKGKSSDVVVVTVQTDPVSATDPGQNSPSPSNPNNPSANVSVNLESKDFTDNEVLVRDATGAIAKTLTWTVKNTSNLDLTNVVLTPGTPFGGLTIGSISPATIPSWNKGTVQIFTVAVSAAANIAEGTNSQSWTLTYDNGKPLAFSAGQSLGFTLKTPPCLEPAQAKAAIRSSLSKISNMGGKLSSDSNQWFCVQDNNAGLMWEAKTDDNGLHDKDWTYSWYQPNATNNAGNVGTANGGTCGKTNSIDCDTDSFVRAVNSEGWCGYNDWRMPTDEELQSLISKANDALAINTDYFPLTQPSMYWSSSSTEDGKHAWYVSFGKGYHAWNSKDSARYVRLVRDVR